MKLVLTDIGHSVELHKMFSEFSKDMKWEVPKPDMWLYRYRDPMFVCLMAKHGKKPVGFVYGQARPYYNEPIFEIEGVFIRRGFRGKLKFIRKFVSKAKEELVKAGLKRVVYMKPKVQKERKLCRYH